MYVNFYYVCMHDALLSPNVLRCFRICRVLMLGLIVCTYTQSTFGDGQQWCFTPGQGALPGRVAQFNNQIGLAVNQRGSLMYVADTLDNVVRQIYCEAGTYNIARYTDPLTPACE